MTDYLKMTNGRPTLTAAAATSAGAEDAGKMVKLDGAGSLVRGSMPAVRFLPCDRAVRALGWCWQTSV